MSNSVSTMGLSWVSRLRGPVQGRLVSLGGTVKPMRRRSTLASTDPEGIAAACGVAVADGALPSDGVVAGGAAGAADAD